MKWLIAALLAVVMVGSGASFARAADEDPEALIRIGNDLRRKGDDRRAEGYFKRAYELAHTPRSAAQLGLVELSLFHYVEAETMLSTALASSDSWVADHRSALEASRAKGRAHLTGVELVGAPRDATVVFADGTVTKVPPDGVVWLAPGKLAFEVQAIGRVSAKVALQGSEGQQRKVEVAMPPVEQPPPAVAVVPAAPPPVPAEPSVVPPSEPTPQVTTAPDAGRPRRIAGIAVGAVGVVATVTGAILLVQGNSKVDATNTAGATKGTYDPSNSNYETLQGAGVGLIVGGAAAIVVGGTLLALGLRHGESSAVSLNVGPVGSHGGLVQLGGAF